MQRVRVLVCGIADLTKDMAERFGITVVPYYVSFAGQTYREDFDFDRAFYYAYMDSADELPTTSHPNTEDLRRAFVEARRNHPEVLYLTGPRRLTKTYSLALQVREELGDSNIRVLDTGAAVGRLALIALAAACEALRGAGLDDVENQALKAAGRTGLFVVLETLKNLLKGGRIGRARAFLGQVLSIKPIVTLRDGVATPAGKALTARQALDWIARRIEADLKRWKGSRIRVVVEHAQNPSWADCVKSELERSFDLVDLFATSMTAVVATHAGPGAWGVAYHVL